MSLTIADFTKTVECALRKVAIVGSPGERQAWYHCRTCGGRKLVRAGAKKPECLVSQLDGAGQ